MSFVIFPVEEQPGLVAMVVGTQGLAPDEAILGRPGHARKMQAICAWLNHRYGMGQQVAWAKQDPTRVDLDAPRLWAPYRKIFERYGKVVYAAYKPTNDRQGTATALTAFLDVMFEERGEQPLTQFQEDSRATQAAWFEHLMPSTTGRQVAELLARRRYVIV